MLAVLLDIEGTTTPISFVHEVLFPFARQRLHGFLEAHQGQQDVIRDLKQLADEHQHDVEGGLTPPSLAEPYLNWLIDQDRKSPALKALQGKIWEDGYAAGTLQAPLFPDVLTAMRRWQNASVSINIFSSGSVLAQKLLFAHTDVGDLRGLINKYFDTGVGKKNETASYERIATELGLAANEIHFVSDVATELDAARSVGMITSLCIRPGNHPQPSNSGHRTIHSFEEME
jgi:enolase-phosphatase E1